MRKWLIFLMCAFFTAAGCGDDDEDDVTPTEDAGQDVVEDTADDAGEDAVADAPEDAPDDVEEDAPEDAMEDAVADADAMDDVSADADADATVDFVARGDYLVNHVSICIDCHTPRNQDGSLDETRHLGGNPVFIDLDPDDDQVGLLPAPNLTPHATGLADWTDEEIARAITEGIGEDGDALAPVMPYWVFHNMTPDDVAAVVAYLRSLDPVDQTVPDRQPLPFDLDQPAPVLEEANIPQTTLATDDPDYEEAQRGRYLASMAGLCIDCHTQLTAQGVADPSVFFAGGRVFPAAAFGLPSPPFPAQIVSANVTPDATGIQGWTAEEIATELKTGVDPEGDGVCPPMPVAMLAYGGLTDEDALAIGRYITTLPPIENGGILDCEVPE